MSATEWERPVDRFKRSAAGTVVSAGLLGLRDALEGRPERDDPAIVAEAPTAPPPGKIEVLIDFERPGHALAIIHVDHEDSDDV
jgi:hypothetical protein